MGELPVDAFKMVLLPEHRHDLSEDPTEPISFLDNTPVVEAFRILQETPDLFASSCKEHIVSLSDSMLAQGFQSTLMVEKKDGKLFHLDGLHRLLALCLAMQKGLKPQQVPCFFFESRS